MSATYTGVSLPVSEKVRDEILTLPCYPELTLEEVEVVTDCINRWKP